MPKSHFVTLIVRLALGFLVLGLLSIFLFTRLRAPKNQTTPNPSDAPVAIITPSPTPQPSSLPQVSDNNDSEGSSKDNGVTSTPKATTQVTNRTSKTTKNGTVTVTSTSQKSSSSATASGAKASASAEARNGYASASASASSW